MTIKEFIQSDVFLPRLEKYGVLVVYDQDQRYRDLCLKLASDRVRVIDASESSIESREAAMATLQDLGEPGNKLDGMLVYVPAKAPVTDEEKQRDPFAVCGVCGAVFPEGDGDEYLSLCLKAKADHTTEIRRIFGDNPNPSFDVIDAVGGGAGWPNLQALLRVESARDILFALLAPSEKQRDALKGDEAWVPEARALLQSTLSMSLTTRGKTWSAIADETWRFLLFSEFVFDLPGPLPDALADVPRGPQEARPLVEELCDRLRDGRKTQPVYIDRAEGTEKELSLPAICEGIEDLGVRDTFPFEERSFFAQAVDALKRDNIDKVREILARRGHSVWIGRGENQAQWTLLEAAVSLIEACEDAARQLVDHARSQAALIDYYVTSLREIDRRQREFEQATSDFIDVQGRMKEVTSQARAAYRRIVSIAQGSFVRHLEKSGWPPPGRLANADVFDKLVVPKLQESGHRVAMLLIDALRYELGVELEKQLADNGQVEIQPAFVQLPSVTPVGMASLLPGAGQDLRLVKKDDQVVPALGDQLLTNVTQRMEILRKRYGQRFQETTLSDFVRGKFELSSATELLVIRSSIIDSHLEKTPEMGLRIVHDSLKEIRVAIHKLQGLRFQDVVIATDHGFFLNAVAEAGDICAKPQGNWLSIHERILLGDGTGDASNFVLPAAHLGIRGEFAQVAGPREMVAYRAGEWYFHGGASLQEAIVPVIAVRLRSAEEKAAKQPKVSLDYRRGAKRITTRLPVLEISVGQGDLFSAGSVVEILLEAHDKKGNVVGEAKPGERVNSATRTMFITPGETIQVTLKMDLDFTGKFTVKALDPKTLTAFSKLDLETDYMV